LAIWFLKEKLNEQELSTSDESIELIPAMWNDVTFEELQGVFSEWIQRVIWVIEHGRRITMNDCSNFLKVSRYWKKPGGQHFLDPRHVHP
jgi:hypothetical protein